MDGELDAFMSVCPLKVFLFIQNGISVVSFDGESRIKFNEC